MKILKNKKNNILSSVLRYSFIIVFAIVVFTPSVFVLKVNAADTGDSANTGDSAGTGINTKILNPLGEDGPQNIPDFIKKIVEIVLYVGIPIIALAIIYTGFLFVQAQGNSEELTKAKKALMYTLIGGALLLGAFVIAQAIGSTVDDIKNGI